MSIKIVRGDEYQAAAFPFLEKLVEAFDQRLHPKEWILEQVALGNFRIIQGKEAAILFDVVVYPSGVAELRGHAAAGDVSEITDTLIPQAEAWAKANNIARCSISSRQAWTRLLPEYQVYKTTIVKDL